MRIACLHTSAHLRDRYSALFGASAPGASVVHVVRDDLLRQVQIAGVDAVVDDGLAALGGLTEADAVLCTSAALGPVIDLVQQEKFLRVDRAMAEQAALIGPRVLLVGTLKPAIAAGAALLQQLRGPDLVLRTVLCAEGWPLYQQGDVAGYAQMIATQVMDAVQDDDVVVLAQSSMMDAAGLLAHVPIPVLAPPDLAVARTLALAG